MRIVELKPQNAKIIYKPLNEFLRVGEFISFTEGELTVIAQVYRILSSDAADNFNQADLHFVLTYKYEKVKAWQGELVSSEATVSKTPQSIIDMFINKNNADEKFRIGNSMLFPDDNNLFNISNFITPVFVGYEKTEENILFTQKLATELSMLSKKAIVLDFRGNIDIPNAAKIVAGEHAKLPLNRKTIENLCPKILEGVSLESKVVITDILTELGEYAEDNNAGFIPIKNLINVIDDFYKKSKIAPLMLLKNKLRHYEKMNIFADTKSEINIINSTFEKNNLIHFDLSNIPSDWQNEYLNNLIMPNRQKQNDFYLFITIDNQNFDNNTLNYLLFKANNIGIKPIISANYRHLAFDSIYDFSKNTFLFKTYNALKKRPILSDILQTLPSNCYMVTGQLTDNLILLENLYSDEDILEVCDTTMADGLDINSNISKQVLNVAIEQANTQENSVQNIDINTLNGALEKEPSSLIKDPADYINTSMNVEYQNSVDSKSNAVDQSVENILDVDENETDIQDAAQESPVTQNQDSEDINVADNSEQVVQEENQDISELPDNQPEIQTIPATISVSNQGSEDITEENYIPIPDSVQGAIPDEIPMVQQETTQPQKQQQIQKTQPEPMAVNLEQTPSNNEINKEPEPEEIPEIDDASDIEQIPDVSEEIDANNLLDDNEILDLVEDNDTQHNSLDDDLFEEVSEDDNIENIALDDLDFLNESEAPKQDNNYNQSENDDDLLDLIEDENQEQSQEENYNLDDTRQELEQPKNRLPQKETLPIYDANYSDTPKKSINLKEGDLVKHNKFGVGTVSKITNHGDKVLCFINFDNLGRKLLDPELSQLEKID